MKFILNNFNTSFRDLKNGETFYYEPSGVIWMKLRDGDMYNSAVALDDGTVCQFDDSERVVKVDVECKISLIKTLDKTLDN